MIFDLFSLLGVVGPILAVVIIVFHHDEADTKRQVIRGFIITTLLVAIPGIGISLSIPKDMGLGGLFVLPIILVDIAVFIVSLIVFFIRLLNRPGAKRKQDTNFPSV